MPSTCFCGSSVAFSIGLEQFVMSLLINYWIRWNYDWRHATETTVNCCRSEAEFSSETDLNHIKVDYPSNCKAVSEFHNSYRLSTKKFQYILKATGKEILFVVSNNRCAVTGGIMSCRRQNHFLPRAISVWVPTASLLPTFYFRLKS